MAILTKTQIQALIDLNLLDNSTGEISPIDLREVCEAFNDSFFNLVTNQNVAGLSEWDITLSYKIDQCVVDSGDIYQALTQTTMGSFIGSEWELISAFSESTSGLAGFILKDNAIELEAGKLVNILTNDVDLSPLDTGIYKAQQVSSAVGLNQQYPIAGKSLVITYKSNVGADSIQYLYPHSDLTVFYVRKLDGSNWILNELSMNSQAAALIYEGPNSVIPGFGTHTNTSTYSSILGGDSNNITSSIYSTIVGGNSNSITFGGRSTILGGTINLIDNTGDLTGNGVDNLIAAGNNNTINNISKYSSILGGGDNTITGSDYSSISGGQNNNTGGFDNVHIIGSGITADADDTTYVNKMNILDTSGKILKMDNVYFEKVNIFSEPILLLKYDLSTVGVQNHHILRVEGDDITGYNMMNLMDASITKSTAVDGTAGNFNSRSTRDGLFINANIYSKFINNVDGSVIVGGGYGSIGTIASENNTVYVPDLRASGTIFGDGAGVKLEITQIDITDSPYSAVWGEDLEIDCTTGNITVNLPTAVSNNGLVINLTKIDSSANKVIYVANGAENVLTNLALEITTQYTNETFKSNGTDISKR